ncbi:MAG: hypothetical protein OXE50_14790 [Chloroflexi bacterium]|nr:hypothetical protein [Chloroflexota bacterium]
MTQRDFLGFFGGANVVEQRREGSTEGVKVDLPFRREYCDAGRSEVDVEAASRVLRDEEEGLGRHVETFATVLVVQRGADFLAPVGMQAFQEPVGQRLQTVTAPLGPVGNEPRTTVLEVEMGKRELAAFVGAQASQECQFIEDAPVGCTGLQQAGNFLDGEGAALDHRAAVKQAQVPERVVRQVIPLDTPGEKGLESVDIAVEGLVGASGLQFPQAGFSRRQLALQVSHCFQPKPLFPIRQLGGFLAGVGCRPRPADETALCLAPCDVGGNDIVDRFVAV